MFKIKNFVFIFIFVILLVSLSACTNNQKLSQLEQSINDLKVEKDSLQDEISLLYEMIADLEGDNKNQSSIIAALRERLFEAENELKEMEELLKSVGNEVYVQLADEYQLVVGDNFQLFYRSVVRAMNPYSYYIKLEGTVGHQYNRYYEFLPDEIGTYDLTLSVCDNNGNVLGSDKTKLVVVSNAVKSNVSKNVLCIGDSLTANGTWVSQGIKKYKASGYTNVKTIGTISKTPSSTGTSVKYEGRGGWQWSSYAYKYDDTTYSPFYSSTDPSKISFKEYCNKNNFGTIDEVYILLTWNGIGGYHKVREFSFTDSLFSNAKIIIDKIHEEFPNAKISLMSIPLPSVNAGLGAYYEIDSSYGDNYAQLCTAMNYNLFVENWCKMEEYSSFMRYIDVMGQFDSEYNMPTEGKDVNNQNTKDELVGNAMGMHPTENGYLQIGDVFYRALMHS